MYARRGSPRCQDASQVSKTDLNIIAHFIGPSPYLAFAYKHGTYLIA